MNKSRNRNAWGACLIAIAAAFFTPMLAVNLAASDKWSGAVTYTTGLKNLGLGDMGRGIGVCGLIGLVSALVLGLAAYLIIAKIRSK